MKSTTSPSHAPAPTDQELELVSALADGQLRGARFAEAVSGCENNPALLGAWHEYHLVGDLLRAPDGVVPQGGTGFLERFQSRLAAEPAVPERVQADIRVIDQLLVSVPANESNFRWKLASAVASLVAVAAIAWNATGALVPAIGPQLAQAPVPATAPIVVVESPRGPVVRDARLEELLAAHKQQGASSALPMPAGFLRNATFESAQNAR